MSVIAWVLAGILMLILFKLKNVWINYQVVGNLIDVIGSPDVQDRLFKRQSNIEKLNRTANQYLFLTRYVPMLVAGVVMVIATMFTAVVIGDGLSPLWSGGGALIIAGAVTWLLTFEAVPAWLYDWHLTVLLTRGYLDLESVTKSLKSMEQQVEAGKFDDLTEVELEYVNLQVSVLEDVVRNVTVLIKDLEQQQEALHAHMSQDEQ